MNIPVKIYKNLNWKVVSGGKRVLLLAPEDCTNSCTCIFLFLLLLGEIAQLSDVKDYKEPNYSLIKEGKTFEIFFIFIFLIFLI